MLASHTVENYLKTIHLAQSELSSSKALVPMGQLASALGVVPGTATTMVKMLAESGLVRYEPYAGVRLTASGEKLAGLVLRRHRLIELFLVKVLGMSWADVHEEAEQLEHAVSERLIDRIDAMLGRPDVDPHGDPIPTARGKIARVDHPDLLSAPIRTPLVVARILDQDATFLRFVEQRGLVPGQTVRIERRDAARGAVAVRVDSGKLRKIDTRAASRILVRPA